MRNITTFAARRAVAAALLVAAAVAQDASSASYKFELVELVGGGGVMASGTKSAVIAVEPVSGSMTSLGVSAEIGLLGGFGVSSFSGPQVVDVAPAFGTCDGGDLVRLRGFNFNQGGLGASVTVRVGSAPAFSPASVSDQEIYFATPPGNGGSADVVVTTAFGSLTLTAAFQYVCPGGPPVSIFSISPAVGDLDGGTLVTLTGLSFLSGSEVLFDGVPATNVTVVNAQTLTCRTPPHAPGYATPTVVNAQGAGSLPLAFEYKAYAKVTTLGGGCPGTYGFPQNFVSGALPIVGGPVFNAVLANAAHNAPVALFLGGEIPGGWIVPGTACLAFVDPVNNFFLPATTGPFGTAVIPLQVPDFPPLIGYPIAAQWFVVDENGALGLFSMTNALRIRLGVAP